MTVLQIHCSRSLDQNQSKTPGKRNYPRSSIPDHCLQYTDSEQKCVAVAGRKKNIIPIMNLAKLN